ncbi:MAG: MBL fold metallo-hydrolase [Chloroflexi bacterium]|nr:MBL fold metallo-hydrolase [Chloroflexota bacterium]
MPALDLAFIGSGNAFMPGGLCCNGFVVNERYLFEAPPQALMSLAKLKIDPNELDAVVLSHHHGDHFLGLPFLLLHWRWKGRTRPVTIVGPKNTRELASRIAEDVFPGVFGEGFAINWVEATPGKCVRVGDLTVEGVLVQHDDLLAETLGYKSWINGRNFGYTGDTILCDAVMDLARTSELLISECASRDLKVPVHMNLVDDIPIVREAMAPDSQLLLTHISPDVTANGLPNTFVAEDFKRYRL